MDPPGWSPQAGKGKSKKKDNSSKGKSKNIALLVPPSSKGTTSPLVADTMLVTVSKEAIQPASEAARHNVIQDQLELEADGIQVVKEVSPREKPEVSTAGSKTQQNTTTMMSVEDLPVHHLLQRSKSCLCDFTANTISLLISRCEKEVDSENKLILQAVISKFGAILIFHLVSISFVYLLIEFSILCFSTSTATNSK